MGATRRKDYYDILGVPRDAAAKDIKGAYRRLARKHHPDVNAGDPEAAERFKEISEAYAVLSDLEKRRQYDRFGHQWEQWSRAQGGPFDYSQGGPGQGFPGGGFTVEGVGDWSDLFESLFTGTRFSEAQRPRSDAPASGQTIEEKVEVTLAEAVFGATKTVQLELEDPCGECRGEGFRQATCSQCGGTGQGRSPRSGPLGLSLGCSACGGRGMVPSGRCDKCRGSGRVSRSRRIEVKIPPGVQTGSKIRVRGEGLASPDAGGRRGDLILVTQVLEDGFLKRRGDDLICEVPITFAEAALGAEIRVPTKDGRVKLTIPPGTQSDQVFRLAGLGVPHLKGKGSGDQLVKVVVTVPKRVSRRARDLIEEWSREEPENPRAQIEHYRLR